MTAPLVSSPVSALAWGEVFGTAAALFDTAEAAGLSLGELLVAAAGDRPDAADVGREAGVALAEFLNRWHCLPYCAATAEGLDAWGVRVPAAFVRVALAAAARRFGPCGGER